ALEPVDAIRRSAKCIAASKSYFYEHESRPILGHDVQLALAIANVTCQDPAPIFDEMRARCIFGRVAGPLLRCPYTGRPAPQVAHSICSSLSIFPERKTASVGQRSTRGLRLRSTCSLPVTPSRSNSRRPASHSIITR